MWWRILLVVPATLGLLYVLALCWVARRQVTTEPRKALIVCDKHGPFPKEYAFDMGGIAVCPMCFESGVKKAKDNLGGGK